MHLLPRKYILHGMDTTAYVVYLGMVGGEEEMSFSCSVFSEA